MTPNQEPKAWMVLLPCPTCGAPEGRGCNLWCPAVDRGYRTQTTPPACTHDDAAPKLTHNAWDDDPLTLWCPDCGAILNPMHQTQDPP